jgi:signal transduction histidine kinase/CheY-like chemotaxis protein
MTRLFILLCGICCFLAFTPGLAPARQLTRAEVLSAYLYNFAKNFTWPGEDSLSAFRLYVITDDPDLRRQTATLARQRVRGKKILVKVEPSPGDVKGAQMIFVARDKKKAVDSLIDRIEGNGTLLVTEGFKESSRIMINFLSTPDQRIRFEINRANIINQGLKILPDMVLLGGSEVDVARIYRQSQQKLHRLRGTVEELQAQQQQLEKEVSDSNRKLQRQQKLIARQRASIKDQKEEFSRQQHKLQALLEQVEQRKQQLRAQLHEGNREIAEKKETISWQIHLIDHQKKQLQKQEENLSLGRKMLEEQQQKIVLQRRKIEEKEELSRQRAILIAKQRNLLYLLAGSLVFIVLLTLLVYQAYREKQHANLLLAREKENAEQANQAKTRFLAHISHELRTPLNAILGFTRLLARDRRLPDGAREKVEVIQKSGRHLLSLISDILDMSKVETGSVSLNPQPVDLHTLLGDVGEMIQARAREKGLKFELELADDLPACVLIDGRKLSQILINLLGNSVKFTRQGRIILRVDSSVPGRECDREQTVTLSFVIEDTGIGISASALEQIFEPFVQEKTEAASQGTGLGLAISRHLVRLMGGDIQVRSTLGQGTTFTFTCAVTVVPESAVLLHRHKGQVLGLVPETPRYTIMIAEDNEPSRKLLEMLLEPVGFAILSVENGKEAVRIFHTARPDLIFMDIRMPVMDGLEATRQIRRIEQEQGGHVPIIALTAHAFEEERKNILRQGCDDFIRKPFSEQEIFQVIARYLGIEYRCEEQGEDGNVKAVVDKRLAQGIRSLPVELCRALREAVQSLDLDAMEKVVGRIRDRDAELAAGLAHMLKNFQYKQLTDVLALCLRESDGEELFDPASSQSTVSEEAEGKG